MEQPMHPNANQDVTRGPDSLSSDSLNTEQMLLTDRLRAATQEAHNAVEQGAQFNRIIMTRISPQSKEERQRYERAYCAYLVASHGFESAVLGEIDRAISRGVFGSFSYLPEAENARVLIEQDLRHLGSTLPLDSFARVPAIDSVAQLLGVEYVRRGSRNGNAIIASVVSDNLGYGKGNGASFLNMYGRQTRATFAAVKEWLNAAPLNPQEIAQSVEAAVKTFQAVGEHLLKIDSLHMSSEV